MKEYLLTQGDINITQGDIKSLNFDDAYLLAILCP